MGLLADGIAVERGGQQLVKRAAWPSPVGAPGQNGRNQAHDFGPLRRMIAARSLAVLARHAGQALSAASIAERAVSMS